MEEEKQIVKKKNWLERIFGNMTDFEFEGNDTYTRYQSKENDDVKVSQSVSEFTLRGKKFKIKCREIKDKRTGKKDTGWGFG